MSLCSVLGNWNISKWNRPCQGGTTLTFLPKMFSGLVPHQSWNNMSAETRNTLNVSKITAIVVILSVVFLFNVFTYSIWPNQSAFRNHCIVSVFASSLCCNYIKTTFETEQFCYASTRFIFIFVHFLMYPYLQFMQAFPAVAHNRALLFTENTFQC